MPIFSKHDRRKHIIYTVAKRTKVFPFSYKEKA